LGCGKVRAESEKRVTLCVLSCYVTAKLKKKSSEILRKGGRGILDLEGAGNVKEESSREGEAKKKKTLCALLAALQDEICY